MATAASYQQSTVVEDVFARHVSALAGDEAPAMLPLLLAAAREHLGMDVGFISEFSEDRRVFRFVDGPGSTPISVGGSDPLEDSYCQRIVDGRFPSIIHDAANFAPALALRATTETPVGAHLGVPLVLSDGTIFGTLCCFSFTPDQTLNERDLKVVQMLAKLTAGYIEEERRTRLQHVDVLDRVGDVLRERDRCRMVFQPILWIESGRVLAVEALSRFNPEPVRSPDIWFAEAASVGLGVDLEMKSLASALRALESIPEDIYLTLNVSPNAVLSGRVQDVTAHCDARRLILELTEHELISNYDDVSAALQPLRERGARLAIDDAGAGYASFRHILKLQPEFIKLDISITQHVDEDQSRAALATALAAFSRRIGSVLIAEGVEQQAEMDTLRLMGIDAAQGYLIGRPDELEELNLFVGFP